MISALPTHEEDAVALLPAMAARGAAGEYFAALTKPIGDLDLRTRDVYEALTDLDLAVGAFLDLRGSVALTTRRGLSDDEYRRLIAGREIAAAGAVTPGAVWAGWTALAGTSKGEMITTAPAMGFLWAVAPSLPTSSFIARARPVVRDLVGATRAVSSVITTDGGMLFASAAPGGSPGQWGTYGAGVT